MELERSIWGVGNRIAAVMGPFVLIVGTVNWWLVPQIRYPGEGVSIPRALGGVMILVGVSLINISFRFLRRARDTETLCTDGPYAIVRHPLYAAWIWFILPGIALLLRLPLLFSASPVMTYLTRHWVPREEAPLEAAFEEKYVSYREDVGALVPRLRQ